MKPLRELTVEDLRKTPVWKSLGGSDAEALVEPTSRATLSGSERETFLAVTEFVLGNGQKHVGFCSPTDNSGLDYVQPVIVTDRGQIRFWFDGPPSRSVIADQWSRLGLTESEVFPVKYQCLVPVDGRDVAGTIAHVESVSGVA
jgi:hypothetical protein